jgi:hypothetical protein
MGRTVDLRLHWVEADPERERAVDALGLGAQADKLADSLLPGMSVLTRRARYLPFICWAVKKTERASNRLGAIHRLEAELACQEAKRHLEKPSECSDVVGAGRARTHLQNNGGAFPRRPEGLYKNMAFNAYRPMMRAFGLLAPGRMPALTEEGERLYTSSGTSGRRTFGCLSEVTGGERTRLRQLWGLDRRVSEPEFWRAQRVRATYDEVEGYLYQRLPASAILEQYENRPKNIDGVRGTLHRAFAWEALSIGLLLAFAMLIERRATGTVAKELRRALSERCRWPGLVTFDPAAASARDVVALLRRAHRLDIGSLDLETRPVALGHLLYPKRDVASFIEALVDRHYTVKLADPWITVERDKVRVLATKKRLDLRPGPRSYRLDAFQSLLRDIHLAA